jgi:MFS family permease
MIQKLRHILAAYPRQFWLMFFGMFLSTVGASMIWPFLMVYVSGKLDQPLGTVASLLTINAVVSLGAAFIAGPVTDRFGRKWVLVVSLLGNALVYLLLGQAITLLHFAILMVFWGLFSPLYRVGGDAMLADLVPPDQRADAYALLRMSNNVGVAIGPAIGGFIASSSYFIAFICAATGLASYGLLLAFFARETLPEREENEAPLENPFAGYKTVLSDRHFLAVTAGFMLAQMCAVSFWVLLGVYTKVNFGIPESQFGLIATTNAVMVILFQYLITQRTKRFAPLRVIAAGAAVYALAAFSVSLGTNFWGFWLSMVVMTVGEMILVPTTSTYVANLAPVDMRGRYMSIYGLSWGVAAGVASPMGGFLNDFIGPKAIWYGAALAGTVGAGLLLRLDMGNKNS